jgi:hypothetical protein
MPAERFGADRAYELLALASLVLHRLEFADRVQALSLPDRHTEHPAPEQRLHVP